LWGGILLGAGLGALGGLAIGSAVAIATSTAGLLLPVAGAFALAGMVYGKEVFTLSGAVAGAVAAGMEISEEREKLREKGMQERERARDDALSLRLNQSPSLAGALPISALGVSALSEKLSVNPLKDSTEEALTTTSDAASAKQAEEEKSAKDLTKMATGEKPYNGDEKSTWFGKKHHKEGERPVFFPRVGLAGAAIGALAGALISLVGGELIHSVEALNGLAALGAEGAIVSAIVIAGTSLIGASYGINRHHYRDVFKITNDLYDGGLFEPTKQHAVAPEVTIAQTPSLPSPNIQDGWKRLQLPQSVISQRQEHGRVQDAAPEHDILH
jgi:hypothetical protein